MRSIMQLTAVLALGLLVGAATAAEPGKARQLFNGQNLDGWEAFLVEPGVKMEDVWSVKDGVLVCKGEPMGYLATKQNFTSFKLVVEWRWPEEPGNSGVLMRITGEPKALPKCVEAQLKHGNAGDVYGFHGFTLSGDESRMRRVENHELAGTLVGVSAMKDAEKPAGEWNTYEITLKGGTLSVKVNGEKVNEATDVDVVAGKIALQSEGGVIHIRKVELTPLAD